MIDALLKYSRLEQQALPKQRFNVREMITSLLNDRMSLTQHPLPAVQVDVPFEELYARNGLQFLPFNTLYQFTADDAITGADETAGSGAEADEGVLLIPDLFAYWLTGERVAEETNASTTGLVPAAEPEPRWDAELATRIGVPVGILPRIVRPGSMNGTLLNGTKVGAEQPLHDGDVIVVGATSVRYEES